ncbi:hypothetical protein, partial [Pseudomonas phage PSA11]
MQRIPSSPSHRRRRTNLLCSYGDGDVTLTRTNGCP